MDNSAISIVVRDSKIKRYDDLLADVRHDGQHHSIRSLVLPDDPDVRDVARVLAEAHDFINTAQEFVNSFTTYRSEVGDYWRIPSETLAARSGDCDDLAILLCSILRNYISPEKVYCAFGLWTLNGETTGHMWVVTQDGSGDDRIIEATAGPERPSRGTYVLYGIFNDKYAFSTDAGLKEFDLKGVQVAAEALVR